VDIGKLLRPIFTTVIIGIIYTIIFLSLRIMYKDVKNGDKKRGTRKTLGLEIISAGQNSNLKKGGVIPVNGRLTIGRKDDNLLILADPYVSSHHVKIYIKNTEYIVEDLGSTNGTLLNGERLEGKTLLNTGDEIKVGSAVFKVIG
jgi:pSer/pThr/pTyr-binding forkhead associated (FHA) protein